LLLGQLFVFGQEIGGTRKSRETGPPLTMIWLLHGAFGLAEDWQDTIPVLEAAGYECRAVDLWRYLAEDHLSLDEWARIFCHEVAVAGAQRNVLLGYSMGGRLALHALLAEPSFWQAGVIVSAHPGLQDEDEKLKRMASDAEWAGQILTEDFPNLLSRWDNQAVLGSDRASERGEDPRLSLEKRHHALARSFMDWSLGKQRDLKAEMSALEMPIMWLTGEADEKFTKLAETTMPALLKGEHRVISAAGHRVPWQAKETFHRELSAFLASMD
jgi:2-succinyl-6-hydroxy-2,4-cyclohexadiene-1-carboxylate synthase